MKERIISIWSSIRYWFTKNDWIWILLGLLLALSLWAVLAWGFGWIRLLPGVIEQKVSEGLLALAYSYIAGCIIFFLTVTLPHITRKRRMMPEVWSDVEHLGVLFMNTFADFPRVEKATHQDINNLDDCKKVLTAVDWNSPLKFAMLPGQNTYLKSFNYTTRKIWDFTQEIKANNKEYLTDKQLVLLNDIKLQAMEQLLDVTGPAMTISASGAEILADMYCEMLMYYNQLKNTFPQYRRNPRDKFIHMKVEGEKQPK